jgi:hypothetical protein
LDDVVRLVPAIPAANLRSWNCFPAAGPLLRAGIGWKKGLPAPSRCDRPKVTGGFTLLSSVPVIVEDLRAEKVSQPAASLIVMS